MEPLHQCDHADRDRCREFENVLQLGIRRGVIFEDDDSAVFRFGPTVVNLLRRSAADELLAPSPVGSPTDAPRIVVTVEVPDTDVFCARLAEQGITLINGPMTRPWGPRTASFADPDGHVWEIAS